MTTKVQNKSFRQKLFETFIPNLDKCLLVYEHLKSNYTRELIDDVTDEGSLKKSVTFGIKQNGNVVNYISPDELLLRLDNEFNSIMSSKKDRRTFLKQIVVDWVNGSLTSSGMLSTNTL